MKRKTGKKWILRCGFDYGIQYLFTELRFNMKTQSFLPFNWQRNSIVAENFSTKTFSLWRICRTFPSFSFQVFHSWPHTVFVLNLKKFWSCYGAEPFCAVQHSCKFLLIEIYDTTWILLMQRTKRKKLYELTSALYL